MYLTEYTKTLLEESNYRIIESKINFNNYPFHFLLHHTFTSQHFVSQILYFLLQYVSFIYSVTLLPQRQNREFFIYFNGIWIQNQKHLIPMSTAEHLIK